MTNNELNTLAVLAKNDTAKAWEIKAHYMAQIEKLAAANWFKMNSETSFMDKCFSEIDSAIKTFDQEKGDFNKRVQSFFDRALREHCGNRGKKRNGLDSYDQLAEGSEEGANALQLVDTKTDVEGSVIQDAEDAQLMAILDKLAGGNVRKRFILGEYAREGAELSQSEVARRLSAQTGNSENTERTFVKRYLSSMRAQGVAVYGIA